MRRLGRTSFSALACFLLVIGLSGCPWDNPKSPQNGGFNVTTGQRYQAANGSWGLQDPVPDVPVAGYYVSNYENLVPQGIAYNYGVNNYQGVPVAGIDPQTSDGTVESPTNNALEFYFVQNGVATAIWNHKFTFDFYCGALDQIGVVIDYSDFVPITSYGYQVANELTPLQTGVEDDCYYYYNGQPGIPPASTRFAITGQEPQTLTLTGQGPVISSNGMPLLYIYGPTHNLINTVTATSISADHTQATFPFPSSLSPNLYSVALVNQRSTGPSTTGTNELWVANSQTISGNPFGVAAGGDTVDYHDCNWDPDYGQYCWSGSNSATFPIVSLYSNNQVLIGNSAVQVGPNPTAVVTNSTGSTSVTSDDGYGNTTENDYTGSTIAVVANSGGNTVTVLDVINRVALSDISVGNQPVALAMSSDGSTAYVANFQDSTVTQVNLNSGTTTATIPVGGKPTSVALTAAGTLWVGGVGFLTEINTQNMSVVAMESTAGKTIAALGFSDAENELVATSTDTSGNVNIDEVSPSAVQQGGIYTAVASHTVSTLGTYTNPQTQSQVHAFTATLGTSLIPINTNLPGSPPLVVQDGWAVVTATPTGFTITDLSGHIVLVSESTPSPVAAIAVDTKLNAAYLTMPDSNTLLTVPLPGTGSN